MSSTGACGTGFARQEFILLCLYPGRKGLREETVRGVSRRKDGMTFGPLLTSGKCKHRKLQHWLRYTIHNCISFVEHLIGIHLDFGQH